MQFNTHAGMERAFVGDGTVELVIKRNDEDRKVYKTELYPGDVLSFPAKYPHAYRATGDKGVTIYVELFCKPGQSLSESSGEILESVDSSVE
jgi:mannose-6-phosphate isomerase-like protein (cupin superfamily)